MPLYLYSTPERTPSANMPGPKPATAKPTKKPALADSQEIEEDVQQHVSQADFDEAQVVIKALRADVNEVKNQLNHLLGLQCADKGPKKAGSKQAAKSTADLSTKWDGALKAVLIEGDAEAYAGWFSIKGWVHAIKETKLAGVKPANMKPLTQQAATSVVKAISAYVADEDNADFANALTEHFAETQLGDDKTEEEAPKGKKAKQTAAVKKGSSKKPAKEEVADDDDDDDDDNEDDEEEAKTPKKTGKKAPVAKQPAAKGGKKPVKEEVADEDDEADEDEEEETKPAKTVNKKPLTKANSKKSVKEEVADEDDAEDDDEEEAKPVKKTAKKNGVKK